MNDTQPILQIKELKTYFKTESGLAKVVDGLSFDIKAGETYALVGESGCGKSITALSIMGLVPSPAGYIAGGAILFGGQDLTHLPPVMMRRIRGNRIAMIFQEPMTALNPVFTVGYQISEVLKLHKNMNAYEARSHAIELLRQVGIPDPDKRYFNYPHQMSGGMRQRVMIAMALACRPELLIADEPTTALDVTIQAQILYLMRQLKRELGTAMLLITHDMGVVRENADRVGVMYAGRLVEEAPREKIFSSPQHPYTRLLLKAIPSRAKRGEELATIKGIVPRATEFPEGCRFSTRCPWATSKCHAEQPPMYDVEPQHTAACFRLSERYADAPPKNVQVVHSLFTSSSAVNLLDVRELKMYFPVRKGIFQHISGYIQAVDGVSFSITDGDTLAIVGESGCGKTTLGKTILRLYEPTGGYIQFHKQDYTRLSRSSIKHLRRKIRMVFQDPFSSLNPRMTVKNIITEAIDTDGKSLSKKESEILVGELLERVGLDAKMANRYPHQFSGGERQRICIARALAGNPELIICDEATSSLDVSVRAQILNLLQKIQSQYGVAYIIITHDLSVVRYLSNRVVVMYLGRVVEEGTIDEIFTEAKHPYTLALLEAVPNVDEPTEKHAYVPVGDIPSPLNPPTGCHFHPRCPYVRPECKMRYPDIISFTNTHKCRCFLYSSNNN